MKPASRKFDLCIYFQCNSCNMAYRVLTDGAEDLLKGKLPCALNNCKGRLKKTDEGKYFNAKRTMILPAVDLFMALGGNGLPDERARATPDNLKKEFEGNTVKVLEVSQAPGTRSFVSAIHFENGKVMHFAGSTKGATIFKVTGG